ncbi:MAG: nicotinate-nucleotide adenylyltransferase [Alkalispirochaetaceae bacterium]
MRTALFGGSFDPVHIGHLFIAEEVRLTLRFDRVLFIPARHSPLKENLPGATKEQRLEMLKLAINGREEFAVSEVELRRMGPSYTIDTIRELQVAGEIGAHPGLIIGDDLTESFSQWKEYEELRRVVRLIVAKREGVIQGDSLGEYEVVDNAVIPVSSSQIRERARRGRAFRYLVPEPVYQFIEANGIYRT